MPTAVEDLPDNAIAPSDGDVRENEAARDWKREVAERLADLPKRYRKAIFQHYYEGRSIDEVGLLNNWSRDKAREVLTCGVDRLRELFGVSNEGD